MNDLDSVAFGVANAGAILLANAMRDGSLSEQKVIDTSLGCVEVVRARTGVTIAEAEAALARATARILDRDCN